MPEPVLSRSARAAFWIAIVLGGLSLAAILKNPVEGVVYAAMLFAAAWGIRRRQAGAAVFLAILLVHLLTAAVRVSGPEAVAMRAMAVVLIATLTFWPARAAAQLWGLSESRRSRAPWAAAALAYVGFVFSFAAWVMPTNSMADTILPGDRFLTERLTWRLGREPRPGDLIAFRYPVDPSQSFVKRVVGVGGDRIRIVNKRLYRNAALVREPYASHRSEYVDSYRDNFPSPPNVRLSDPGTRMLDDNVRDGELIVPPGKYFVMGDNRDSSLDSRYWGFVSRGDILGSPLLVYASFPDAADEPAKKTAAILDMRWERLFKLL